MKNESDTDSDSESDDYPQNSYNQTSADQTSKKLVELNEKCNQNIQNEIEQEVQMLMKHHYVLQLNIQTPISGIVNLFDQEEKEIYLQLFIDRKKQVQKRIDETKQNMDLLIKIQTQLYEVSQHQPLKISQHEKNNTLTMENIKKQDQNFASLVKKLQGSINYFQAYIDHYNQLIPNKIKSTYDHDSQPYQVLQDQNEQKKQKNIIELDGDSDIGFIEEIKDESENIQQKSIQSQINSSTQPTSVMTRRKAQQLMSSQGNDIKEFKNQISEQQSQKNSTSPIKQQNQESNESKIGKNPSSSQQNQSQNSKNNSELNAKSQQNENSKPSSQSKQNANQHTSASQSTQISQSSASSSSSKFDDQKQQNQKQPSSLNLSSNIQSYLSPKNGLKPFNQQNNVSIKQHEEIVIKSDYEEQQEKFKNYNIQFKQFYEKLNLLKEEFESIIFHLKTYQHNFCFSIKTKQNNFFDVQKAIVSQLDKCFYFLDATKRYNEQINLIEDQFLYFPDSSDLSQNFQMRMKKKLKVTKQMVFSENLEQQANNTPSQTNKLDSDINQVNKQFQIQPDNLNSSDIQVNINEPQTQNYSYMKSLKLFYEPHTVVLDHKINIDNTIQQYNSFEEKFFEQSKQFFYQQENSSKIEKLLKKYEQINNISTKS